MSAVDQQVRTPTKWQVREWLTERRAERSRILPTPEEVRCRLGWRRPQRTVNSAERKDCAAVRPTEQEAS